MDSGNQIDIYQYLSAREFLQAEYSRRKKALKKYSHPQFSVDLGLSPSSHIYQFIAGQRFLSEKTQNLICKKMRFNKQQKDYFRLIVQYEATKSATEKSDCFARIIKIRKNQSQSDLNQRTLDYLSEWYIPVIREMVLLADFQSCPEWIAAKLGNVISVSQAAEAFSLLQNNNFVRLEITSQKWVQSQPELELPKEIAESLLASIHGQFLSMANNSVWTGSPEKKEILGSSLGIKRHSFAKMQEELRQTRQKLIQKYESSEPDLIVQMGSQLLQLTE